MCSYQKVKISPPLNKRLCEGGGRRKKGAGTTSDALFLRCSTLPQLLLVKLLTIISVSWSIPPPTSLQAVSFIRIADRNALVHLRLCELP